MIHFWKLLSIKWYQSSKHGISLTYGSLDGLLVGSVDGVAVGFSEGVVEGSELGLFVLCKISTLPSHKVQKRIYCIKSLCFKFTTKQKIKYYSFSHKIKLLRN